jgi:hypothetical protein
MIGGTYSFLPSLRSEEEMAPIERSKVNFSLFIPAPVDRQRRGHVSGLTLGAAELNHGRFKL